MKILHLSYGYGNGGAETFAIDTMLALQERGVEQFVLYHGNNNFRNSLRCAKIPHKKLNFVNWKKWIERWMIQRRINAFSPDIVHCWTPHAAAFIPRNSGVPSLGWFGGYHKIKHHAICDYYMGVTLDIVQHIQKQDIRPDKVFLGHTFGTLPQDAPLSRATFGIPDGKPVILLLARMHWVKGVDILLRASVGLDAFLLLCGDGPELETYRKLAHDLGLESRVCFPGWRQDRSALLDLADILAVPSRDEPFGTVMPEAWYKKVPVVAAKAQGPRFYIKHGENGMLCEIENVDGLTKNLNAVLSDSALRKKLIAGGIRTYETLFTKDAVTSELMANYEEIIRRGVIKNQ